MSKNFTGMIIGGQKAGVVAKHSADVLKIPIAPDFSKCMPTAKMPTAKMKIDVEVVRHVEFVFRDSGHSQAERRGFWVPAEVRDHQHLHVIDHLSTAYQALRQALSGLEAGCAAYATRTQSGSEVPGDEQYPWVRAMQIGRDAARKALADRS